MVSGILIAMAVVGAVGLFIGLFLGIAGIKFKVEVDEREEAVLSALPGNNCGGCGYAGCDALAKAIVEGKAKVNQCPVGGASVGDKIAAIMGVEAGAAEKMVAFVKCKGTCDKANVQYNYYGMDDCVKIAAAVPGAGDKACSYGCLGSGSCVKACQFDAIHINAQGVAEVDKEKCTNCGACREACPRKLIVEVPYKQKVFVNCANKERGPAVTKVCANSCIGCGLCEKTCKFDAIHVVNNVAVVDYDKCRNCTMCAKACPRNAIEPIPTPEEKEKFKAAQKAAAEKKAAAAKAAAEAAEAPKAE